MKPMKYTVLLLLITTAWAQEKPKLAEVYVSPNYVAVDGVWEPDNPTKDNELSFSTMHMECNRHGGREFGGTDAFCLVADATRDVGTINVGITWMKVIQWNGTQIIAVDDSPICMTSQTILDLSSKTVSALDIKRANAKGLKDICKMLPDRQTYYLRDKVDYMLNHKPVKK